MDCMAARNLKIETNVLYDYLFYFCNMSHFYSIYGASGRQKL